MENVASEQSRSSVPVYGLLGRALSLLAAFLLFLVGIELLELSFDLMGRSTARALLQATSDPAVGLFIGILATSLVQSSSTVTSMTVAVVAGGGLNIAQAIPLVMGANIGTSVTNTVVSFGSVTRRGEFRRAMAAATVHDLFNLLAVGVLFPLELAFGIVSRLASALTDRLAGTGGLEMLSPLDHLMEPLADFVVGLVGGSGPLVLVVGLGMIFAALRLLVRLLRALFLGRFEGLLDRYIFNRPFVAFVVGIGLTFLVQSSSITTSLTVPLVAAGLLTVTQIYPFVLGANLGTTLTAFLAALATGVPAALAVAFAHLAFNALGMMIFFPIRQLRQLPIRLAEGLGRLCERSRWWAVGYVAAVFFIIPLTVILATRGAGIDYRPDLPEAIQQQSSRKEVETGRSARVERGSLLRAAAAKNRPNGSGGHAAAGVILSSFVGTGREGRRIVGGIGVASYRQSAVTVIVGRRPVVAGDVSIGPDERAGADDSQDNIIDEHGRLRACPKRFRDRELVKLRSHSFVRAKRQIFSSESLTGKNPINAKNSLRRRERMRGPEEVLKQHGSGCALAEEPKQEAQPHQEVRQEKKSSFLDRQPEEPGSQ